MDKKDNNNNKSNIMVNNIYIITILPYYKSV